MSLAWFLLADNVTFELNIHYALAKKSGQKWRRTRLCGSVRLNVFISPFLVKLVGAETRLDGVTTELHWSSSTPTDQT